MRPTLAGSFVATLLVLVPVAADAQYGECRHQRTVTARVEMAPGAQLQLKADAGTLTVTGVAGLREARVRGSVCASSTQLMERATVTAATEAGAVVVETRIPNTADQFTDGVYVRIDLIVEVPAGTSAAVQDASGAAELRNLGDLVVHDGSGDLHIEDVNGVIVHDGSGSVEIRRARGVVEVHDGSGDVVIREAGGHVRIHDGSGSIHVDGVRGDFLVLEDGSGSIHHANVTGRIDVPRRRGR